MEQVQTPCMVCCHCLIPKVKATTVVANGTRYCEVVCHVPCSQW
jgi:hypothetical protein